MSVHLILYDASGAPLGNSFDYTTPGTFLFGRDPSAHCSVMDDPVVSRKHYFIEISPPHARLHDLGSRNGIRVNEVLHGGKNGVRNAAGMVQPIDLRPGDRIRAGKTVVEFQVRADAPAPEARLSACAESDVDLQGATIIVPRVASTQATSAAAPSSSASAVSDLLAGLVDTGDRPPRIPGYSLAQVIGKGGMGTVYLADRVDGSRVAIKVLQSAQMLNENNLERFRREIAIARSLFHENIVNCIEDGCAEGRLFLALEYLPHGSLSDKIAASGPLTPKEALPYMIQLLTGLAFAHSRNFVHRDLKPANVLFGGDRGEVAKLTDFGLAKSFVDAGLSNFTMTGTAAGTLTCVPPEQLVDFKHVRPSADIFSMGATFYEMLTGRSPYNLGPDKDGMAAVLSFDLTPLSRLRPDLPSGLTARIDQALLEDATARYRNGTHMLEAFRELL